MNKPLTFVALILISVLLIALQSTILSPGRGGYLFPDLNLILIVFLAVYAETKGGFLLAAGNGYMMDVLSGNMPGTFTISRLSAYLLVRTSSHHVYLGKIILQGFVIFLTTIFAWTFIATIIRIKSDAGFNLTFGEIILQGLVNSAVGVPLFWAAGRMHARLQK